MRTADRALDCDGREIREGDRVWAGDLSGPATATRVYEKGPGDWRIDTDMPGRSEELPEDWSLKEIAPPPYGIVDPCPGCGEVGEIYTMPAPGWAVGSVNAARVSCRCGWSGPTVTCKGGKKALDAAKRKAVKLWNRRA